MQWTRFRGIHTASLRKVVVPYTPNTPLFDWTPVLNALPLEVTDLAIDVSVPDAFLPLNLLSH